MARPRFQFVCTIGGTVRADGSSAAGRTGVGIRLGAGIGFGDGAGAGNSADTGDQFAWRLLGANNRELGRSPVWYPDLAACREAVQLLKREIGAATSAITSTGTPGAWSWRLAAAGRPVAMAGRPYHRHRECAYNLSHFLDAVPTALVADEPLCGPVRGGGAGLPDGRRPGAERRGSLQPPQAPGGSTEPGKHCPPVRR
jgi:hypothetical protein